MRVSPVLIMAAAVLLVLIAAAIWVALQRPGGGSGPARQIVEGTNLGLDIRYRFDADVFTPEPFNARAEYPFQLNADGWGLYGKRIRGIGAMLTREPGPMLYDFVGSQNVDVLEDWYKLERTEEVYEDDYLNGKLILHCKLAYKKTAEFSGWPRYFPHAVTEGSAVHMDGWVFFSEHDLFYFYAIGAQPLGEESRLLCHDVLESLEFDVVMGIVEPEDPPVELDPDDEAVAEVDAEQVGEQDVGDSEPGDQDTEGS